MLYVKITQIQLSEASIKLYFIFNNTTSYSWLFCASLHIISGYKLLGVCMLQNLLFVHCKDVYDQAMVICIIAY